MGRGGGVQTSKGRVEGGLRHACHGVRLLGAASGLAEPSHAAHGSQELLVDFSKLHRSDEILLWCFLILAGGPSLKGSSLMKDAALGGRGSC